MLYRRIDISTGEFIEDVIYEREYPTPVSIEDKPELLPLPEYLVSKPVPSGMYTPAYINGEWVESEDSVKLVTYAKENSDKASEYIKTKEKSIGKVYSDTGVVVPFRSADALAMLQVKAAFEVGVTNTNIKFSNGEVLYMTSRDFPAFAAWFANERNQFFL